MVFDIAALVFVLVFSLIMMKRGGMKAILSLGGFALSIVVASMLYPALTDMVYETPLPENLEKIVSEAIVVEDEDEFETLDTLPDFIKNALTESAETAVESISRSLAAAVTRLIINIIIFVLLIVVTKVCISLLSGTLNIVTKLPVLHELNALVGFVCGLVISLVIVWIAVALTGAFASTNLMVAQWIKDSYVVGILSNITPF
ncbi:MAG: CvpA family protein [Clostridia bacterium]|nr:CvpA family protein [Clostridia bacterium]